jgi:23S rRNA (adenine2503-C2)-methyltransferase
VGCRFCGAGDSFVRSLTAEEIVAQVDHLFQDQARCQRKLAKTTTELSSTLVA